MTRASNHLAQKKIIEAAGLLYGGYIARGGYQAGCSRLDFDSFLDALPTEFWKGEKVEQEMIEEFMVSAQGIKSCMICRVIILIRFMLICISSNKAKIISDENAQTIPALELLGELEADIKRI